MELADVLDSKSSGGNTVRVRLPPSAPLKKYSSLELYFFLCPLLHISVVFNIPKVFIVGFSKYVTVGSHYVVVIAVVFRVQGCLN